MSRATLMTEFQPMIRAGLRDALSGEGCMARIGRYHVGLTDIDDRPADRLGKLLRPTLVLFTASQLGGSAEAALPAALGLELVHSFSLVHDDIQDGDRVRRGRPAVWSIWGSAQAINAGDYLHALGTCVAASCGGAVVRALARATEQMIEGQSMDLSFEGRFVDEPTYVSMIDRKTAALFRCAFELGGLVAGRTEDDLERLGRLGRDLGRAFQVQDDLLGIWGDGEALGKPVGSDIRRRKKSFPVSVLYARADDTRRSRLEAIYQADRVSEEDVSWVVEQMDGLQVREAARTSVDRFTQAALDGLASLPFAERGRDELSELIATLARRSR